MRRHERDYDISPFINRLKFLRLSHRLTQPELAEKLGMSRGSIGHYEAGVRMPGLNTLHKMSIFFNVSCDFLIGISEYKNLLPDVDYLMSKLYEAGVVTSAKDLDREKIDKIIEYITLFDKTKLLDKK